MGGHQKPPLWKLWSSLLRRFQSRQKYTSTSESTFFCFRPNTFSQRSIPFLYCRKLGYGRSSPQQHKFRTSLSAPRDFTRLPLTFIFWWTYLLLSKETFCLGLLILPINCLRTSSKRDQLRLLESLYFTFALCITTILILADFTSNDAGINTLSTVLGQNSIHLRVLCLRAVILQKKTTSRNKLPFCVDFAPTDHASFQNLSAKGL